MERDGKSDTMEKPILSSLRLQNDSKGTKFIVPYKQRLRADMWYSWVQQGR